MIKIPSLNWGNTAYNLYDITIRNYIEVLKANFKISSKKTRPVAVIYYDFQTLLFTLT